MVEQQSRQVWIDEPGADPARMGGSGCASGGTDRGWRGGGGSNADGHNNVVGAQRSASWQRRRAQERDEERGSCFAGGRRPNPSLIPC
jgi:hypothetical protein